LDTTYVGLAFTAFTMRMPISNNNNNNIIIMIFYYGLVVHITDTRAQKVVSYTSAHITGVCT